MSDMKIKAWDVTVRGYGVARYYAATRGKALAEAWRSDAFSTISFKDFLKIASCFKAMFVHECFAAPITVGGKPAFFVERSRSYVRAAEAGSDVIGNYHPSEVLPESFRPERYRTTPTKGQSNDRD